MATSSKVPHPMRKCHLSSLSKGNEDSMWCHDDVLCHIGSPSSNEEVLIVIIHNFSFNEEATHGIWEGLHLMKVLSREGFI